jgi:nitroreductase
MIMKIPFEIWYPALFKRQSRRSFLPRLPEEGIVARLESVCREFRPFSEVRVELVKDKPEKVFKGIIGRYGKVTGAPHYMAFVGDMSSPRVQECTGYVGEAVVLEATALGLGTCWVGGMFRPKAAAAHVPLEDGEKVLSVTPVGYAEESHNTTEKLFKRFAKSAKRKSLNQLIINGHIHSPWVGKALEAARLAPSAANRQPWRFGIGDDSITISMETARDSSFISRRMDCGIAMLHIELGALAAGVTGRWEFLDNPDVAKFVV